MTHLNELPLTENNLRDAMIASAIKGKIYSKAGCGLPKGTVSKPKSLKIAIGMPNAEKRNITLRMAIAGVTAKQLSERLKTTSQKASHYISMQKSRGYVEITGQTAGTLNGPRGVNIYGITSKGKELLAALGE